MSDLPNYDELPRLGETDLRQAWDVWGRDDRRGTLNHVTAEVRLRALALPVAGDVIDLTLPLGQPSPPLYGRPDLVHTVFQRDRNTVEDMLDRLDLQASSQWDALRHMRARQFGFYGGIEEWDSDEASELGIHQLARSGVITRGVLVDVDRARVERGADVDDRTAPPITVEELTEVLDQQGTVLEPGDVMMLRTGWLRRAAGGLAPDDLAMPPSVGLEGSEAVARFVWDNRLAAIAADNPAVEALPGDPAVGSLHRRLIPCFGMPLGELWDLEALSAHVVSTGRHEVCLVSVPLHLAGGVGSPANAVAVV